MQQLGRPVRSNGKILAGLIILAWLLASCSTAGTLLPIVSDESLERLVKDEAAKIIAVSEDKGHFSDYQIYISDFPRKDILGMSFGNRRIYISHQLAKSAAAWSPHLWLLRQTLAHEIAHETAGHARQSGSASFNRPTLGRVVSSLDIGLPGNVALRNYSMENELEADSKALEYWHKLGWNCRIWVRILQDFEKHNYAGDALHPTDLRLQQAERGCPSENAGVT